MLLTILEQSPPVLIGFMALLGLMVGSFLNVVIYRLPIMLQQRWRQECQDFMGLPFGVAATPAFNLLLPGSHCPSCQTAIKAYHNIPLFGFLLLGGRCRNCRIRISWRYPLVEALAAIAAAIAAWRFGFNIGLPFALILSWALIVLSAIDIDQQLLPDDITQPTLWLGLLLSLFSVFADSGDSIIGAVAGYLSLWGVYQCFKLFTGKEGMGNGDFKLLALCGAWLGWQYLPQIVLLASCLGTIGGIALIGRKKLTFGQAMPFGPYLAVSGWLALIWGEQINRLYLQISGL